MFDLRTRIATDRALVAKGTFYDFFPMVWHMLDPAPLVRNWHIEQVCIHLEAMSLGEIRKLLINIPPGSGKSNLLTAWNIWEWIHRPQTKFLFMSYDASLVGTRDGGKVVKVLQSDWFKMRWGELLPSGKPAASMFDTKAGGFRFSTSPGGKATGRHADIRGIDDPLKPKDTMGGATQTKAALRTVSEFIGGTMSSRATDLRTVRDLIVMQRLHEEDPCGEMLAKGGWLQLRFPMLYEAAFPCKTQWGGDPRETEGDLLFPERFPLEEVTDLRDNRIGLDGFAAQYQQRPVRQGGSIFQRSWWRFFHTIPDVPEPCLCDRCHALKRTIPGCREAPARTCRLLPFTGFDSESWDCTFKKSDTSDFVAGGVFRAAENGVFLLDVRNERLSFTQTIQAIRDMSLAHPHAYDKLIEDKANGPAVEDALRAEIPGLTLVNPMGGKPARANAGSVYMSGGRFYLPHPDLAPWVWSFMAQHEGFPNAAFDDMVDMTSQYLVRLKSHGEHFSAAMARIRQGLKP